MFVGVNFSFDVNSDFPLGDSKTTSCNVFDLGFDKTTKQKRSVDNSLVYLGRNSPLVENKFYRSVSASLCGDAVQLLYFIVK